VLKPLIISINKPEALTEAVNILLNNGVIAIPTDTVYGIACLAFNSTAIERIFSIKSRDFNKALPILIGNLKQLELIAQPINKNAEKLVKTFWPGALTLVVLRKHTLPENLSPYPTVGVRLPKHAWLIELIKNVGPLATTSANLSGQPEAHTAMEVAEALNEKIDLIIDGGQSQETLSSTVVDCSGSEIKILREGPIKSAAISNLLR
jgi:L-threonylcarbamoyladenylate synthase